MQFLAKVSEEIVAAEAFEQLNPPRLVSTNCHKTLRNVVTGDVVVVLLRLDEEFLEK